MIYECSINYLIKIINIEINVLALGSYTSIVKTSGVCRTFGKSDIASNVPQQVAILEA
jgi:hypothetical protein